MNTSNTTPSVTGTPTATFYAFEASGREGSPKDVVIVALNSWLGRAEGWSDAKADVVTLPDGTVANLDPASAHKRYASLDPASCNILNVITCPAKPGAGETRQHIVDGWKKNGTARVPWDLIGNKLVLRQVTLHGECDIIRLFLTHLEGGTTYPKDRPSSWQGITAIPPISEWTEADQQEMSRIVSGSERIDCFRVNSRDTLAKQADDPVILQVRALSNFSSRHESIIYEFKYPSIRGALRDWSSLGAKPFGDRVNIPHPVGSLYIERENIGDIWIPRSRSIDHAHADSEESVKGGTGKRVYPIYYKINDGSDTYGLFRARDDARKILGTALKAEISFPGVEARLENQQGQTFNAVFSTSSGGLDNHQPRQFSPPPTILKEDLPWSIGDQHLVFDLCESARQLHGSQLPDS
jgi:hypothetical protein